MNIRKLNENDYEQYKKLINDFRETNFTFKQFIEILNVIKSNSDIWVIEKDNLLIATGTIIYEYKFIRNICKLAHIEDVCILKDYRGNGYGKILIDFLINEAKTNKCYKITLYCDDKIEQFYKNSNFEKNGIQMAIYF